MLPNDTPGDPDDGRDAPGHDDPQHDGEDDGGDDAGTASTDHRPPWWVENDEIRAEYELPRYDPPVFDDGVYVHDVVSRVESRLDCHVQFVDPDPREDGGWEIRVDGTSVAETGRRRDTAANTVFSISSTTFERTIEDHLRSR
jgi:hypothetical protein